MGDPDPAREEGYLAGPVDVIRIPEGVENHPSRIGENDHARCVLDLLVQVFHHGPRLVEKRPVLSGQPSQFVA